MPLSPEETHLQGSWIERNDRVVGDATCERISRLTTSELERLASDSSDWGTLFHDPRDGFLWERDHPESEMHGDGPPTLTAFSFAYAAAKYDIIGNPSGVVTSRRATGDALAAYVAVVAACAE